MDVPSSTIIFNLVIDIEWSFVGVSVRIFYIRI